MNELTISPDRFARFRELCLAFPQAEEKEAWGHPTWRVRDKIFAMLKGNYEGGRPSAWLKAGDGEQEALVAADPETYFVPPYVGHKGWIGISLDTKRVRWKEIAARIETSYRLTAPKRVLAEWNRGDSTA